MSSINYINEKEIELADRLPSIGYYGICWKMYAEVDPEIILN